MSRAVENTITIRAVPNSNATRCAAVSPLRVTSISPAVSTENNGVYIVSGPSKLPISPRPCTRFSAMRTYSAPSWLITGVSVSIQASRRPRPISTMTGRTARPMLFLANPYPDVHRCCFEGIGGLTIPSCSFPTLSFGIPVSGPNGREENVSSRERRGKGKASIWPRGHGGPALRRHLRESDESPRVPDDIRSRLLVLRCRRQTCRILRQ